MAKFEDFFSSVAERYARFRPLYPAELFAKIAALAPGRVLAWDCGTGSGQAAVGLAEHFERVRASDASSQQIAGAIRHPRIEYVTEAADAASLASGSVDAVTAASAAHWFELDSFYDEVRRVLRPGGVVALWCYREPSVNAEIDPVIKWYQDELLGPFWPAKINYVMERYQTLPFPFREVPFGPLTGRAEWDLAGLVGYFSTWSAGRAYTKKNGESPLPLVEAKLSEVWGDPLQKRELRWPLHIRLGFVD